MRPGFEAAVYARQFGPGLNQKQHGVSAGAGAVGGHVEH